MENFLPTDILPKKVMLIFPPITQLAANSRNVTMPFGISYLGAYLREQGHEVTLLDACMEGHDNTSQLNNCITYGLSIDAIVAKAKIAKPDVVGISCILSSSIHSTLAICAGIREKLADAIIVLGGNHPTFHAKELCSRNDVDFVVLGEGELTFSSILACNFSHSKLAGQDGLAFISNVTGKYIENPPSNFIENLDLIPFPARDLLDIEGYFRINMPHGGMAKSTRPMAILSSRGCNARCCFCSSTVFWGKRIRFRSVENVLAELSHCIDAYNASEFHWIDDNLTADRERSLAIFQGMIDHGLTRPWTTPNGIAVWTLDEELLRLMKKSGCYEICLAVESGSQDVLKNIIKKPLRLDKVKEIADLCKKIGIRTKANFVFGFPNETPKQIKESFRFGAQCSFDSVNYFIVSPLPGTPLYKECVQNDLFEPGFNYTDMNFRKPNIKNKYLTSRQLLRLASRQFLLQNLSALIRDPVYFARKYFKYIRKKPLFILGFLVSNIKNAFR